MSMAKIRILVADDYESVRKGVCAILTTRDDVEVCAEAANGEEAVHQTKELKPDIVIMDFSMPVMDGLEASKRILQEFPDMPILMFSMHKMEALSASRGCGAAGGAVLRARIVGFSVFRMSIRVFLPAERSAWRETENKKGNGLSLVPFFVQQIPIRLSLNGARGALSYIFVH